MSMTTSQNIRTVAALITASRRAKGFIQPNGRLRVVARSCATARVEINRACRRVGLSDQRDLGEVFEVRFVGTKDVLAYPFVYDPMRTDTDRRTGALING